MNCPNCSQSAQNIRTAIRNGKLITTCELCSKLVQPHQLSAKNHRTQQSKDYAKDIVQPTDKRAYTKAYPVQAREMWGDDETRKFS